MADLIAYTDLASYLGVTFTAAEQTTATLACGLTSDLFRGDTNRSFEIQGSAADRYFTYVQPYSVQLGPLAAYYPWPGVFPFSALTTGLPAPVLMVDDYFLTGQTLGAITVADKTTLTTYTPTYAYPYNADSKGNPYTGLVFAVGTALPTGEGQLKVNAKWGYVTAIPTGLKELALLQAARFFKRKDAPFGVAGVDQANGFVMRLRSQLDPDVEAALHSGYGRWYAAV